MKYLIFDFNGTIVDDLPLVMEIMTETLKPKGVDLSKYSLNYLRQQGVKNFMKEIKISKLDLLFIYQDIKSKIKAKQSDCPLVDTLKDYLPALSKKYTLLIYSSNHPQTIENYLQKNNIDQYFSDVYEDDSYFGKEVGLKKIIKELKIQANNAVYFGDESRDIVAAKKAGLTAVAVTWGFEGSTPLSAARPDFIIDKPEQLLSLEL